MSAAESSAPDPQRRGWLRLGTAIAAWRRQRWACAAGLLVGWTTVVYALIWTTIIAATSGFGIILVAIYKSGNGAGQFLLDDVQVGIFSVAASILGGLRAPGYLIAGAVFAQLVVLAMTAAEPWLLSLQGYRRLSHREAALIEPLLDSVCAAMGVTQRPAVWVAEKHTVGAWTHLRTIVLHEAIGLHAENRMLDDGELEALLAHEMHHWRSGDAIADRLAWACSLPVYIPYRFGMKLQEASPLLAVIGWFFLWPSWALIKLVVGPLAAAGARAHEWDADAAAARAGYREPLRRLLEQEKAFEPPRSNWEKVLYATHPPVELRLERLDDEPLPASAERGVRPPPPLPASAVLGRLLPAAALVIVVVLVFQADPFGSSSSAPSTKPVPGAHTKRSGVPVGYAPDARGAAAAAANYNQSLLSTSADPSQFEPAIRAMAAPAAAGRLVAQARAAYGAAVANTQASNPGVRGIRLSESARTLAERPGPVSPSRATVEVASSVSVTLTPPAGSGKRSDTRHRCSVYAYDLDRVEGDWKLVALRGERPPAGDCTPAGFTAVPH